MLHKIKELAFVLSGKLNANTKSKIVFYHDVHSPEKRYTDMSTSMDIFIQHIEILKAEGYTPVAKIKNKTNQIQINFDDGFKGIYDNKDYFVKHNLRPTIFLAISLIGQEGYMNASEILELQDLGFIFESHAYAHENLTSFNDEDLNYELKASKAYLEDLLKKEVNELCFPIGYFSDRVLNCCKDAGYKILYSSLPGNYHNKRTDGLVYRNLVQFSSPSEFKAIVNGAMSPFFGWYKRKQYVNPDENR
ncbi:polysaccharide deacetylase family protein [Psychroserpens damuponensis]|uniref:polysaccharide deacetylase family protein n=1 Tax=Psychroserpens damuponensis TaxID=943936 RepID=UPI00058FDECF|nr:polysaccharide deacetylase family protein [Psychroserpens damuponensis]